ncbi:MAG: SHOCT domain-containing protein [Phaeodactylibacter sp.]|nr:SHOCT domain-containing protein [Phaeodactylibacter sp.]MCB9287855.1 SHOCT domain-containing protein [Lewinellaceae bacterium]
MMFLWVIVLIIVIAGAWSFTRRRKNNPLYPGKQEETPLEILKNRFAKGEITREEYEERKEVLEEKEFM